MDAHAQFFPDEIKERELPPCDLEHLDELLLLLKTSHPTVRSRLLRDLACDDGAYIVKLLDLFDVSEIDAEPPVLHRIFDICYALLELCDRRVLEILLSDQNFLSVVGVFGHNPGLLRAMDFRTELEGKSGFNEVIPFLDASVRQRVHQNFRIHVIKDNVLSRSLPDCTVIMLDHIVNENNYHILSYISDSDAYWQAIKTLVKDPDQQRRRDGLGLLKEVIQLVRTTRPLDKLPQQLRRDGFGAPPVFGQLLNQLFGDGAIFEAFSEILGSPQSSKLEIERALDILNTLVLYQGPERLRTYLASEGRCIAPPTSDKERIQWKHGASLFTALLVVFETYEATRVQLVTLLKEICKVSLPQDDKFLNVMYPNYMQWLLQPLKYLSVDEEGASLFALQDSIMELLTFCTEAHGYRIKYLFGRQPIASYVDRMLRSRNKLFVIHAVKFMRACAARGEAFFSRFLIQNDLFTPMMEKLKSGQRNTCAVSSAILELLAYIEKSNLSSLVEHIYRKFYDTYKDECPIVFQALRVRFEDTFGASSMSQHADGHERDNVLFVQHNASMMDDEDARYWETDDPPESFAPAFVKDEVPATGQVRCRVPKLTDNGEDDDDEPASPLKEGDLMIPSRDEASPAQVADDSKDETMSSGDESKMEDEEEEDFQLPVREKKTEEDFLAAAGVNGLKLHTKKKTPSPQVKSMFQQISWKVASPNSNGTSTSSPPSNEGSPDSTDATATAVANGHGHAADENDSSSSPAKRKLDIAAAPPSSPEESILKKAKPCTPVSSS